MGSEETVAIRKADETGKGDHGWLQSRFTFSFADYYDPNHMGYRALRVINDDLIAAGQGFGTHPHRDMEIVSYVVEGALEHKDSMGNGSVVRPGDVQRMSAGTGIRHSEFNPLQDQPMRLLQIWIEPEQKGLAPGYEQTHIGADQKRNRLTLIASRDGRDGSVTIHQDAAIFASIVAPAQRVERATDPARYQWIQIVEGHATINGHAVERGDGLSLTGATHLEIEAVTETELLLFDLA